MDRKRDQWNEIINVPIVSASQLADLLIREISARERASYLSHHLIFEPPDWIA